MLGSRVFLSVILLYEETCRLSRAKCIGVNVKKCTRFAPKVVHVKVTMKVIIIEVQKSPSFCYNNSCERSGVWTKRIARKLWVFIIMSDFYVDNFQKLLIMLDKFITAIKLNFIVDRCQDNLSNVV